MVGFWEALRGKKEEEPGYVPKSERIKMERTYRRLDAKYQNKARDLERQKREVEKTIKENAAKGFVSQDEFNLLAKQGYRLGKTKEKYDKKRFKLKEGKLLSNDMSDDPEIRKDEMEYATYVQRYTPQNVYEDDPLADSVYEAGEARDKQGTFDDNTYNCDLDSEEQNYLTSLMNEAQAEKAAVTRGKEDVKKKVEELEKS